jgi:hypothetical protein
VNLRDKPFEVTWDDACTLTGQWHERSEAISKRGRALVRVTSVGYVIYLDKHVLVMVSSVHGPRVGDVQVIPRGNVVKRRRVQ